MSKAVQCAANLRRMASVYSVPASSATARSNFTARTMASFYQIKAKTLDGQVVSMSDFKGKTVLIQNTASL